MDLRGEIESLIVTRIDAGQILQRSWITQEILCQHPIAVFPDSDFYRCCARETVAAAVRKVNALFKEEPETVTQGQLPLAGYTYLQRAYPLTRDGELLLVPIMQMTLAELNDKARCYDKMSDGCRGHADELRRFAADLIAA
jgi:hypothetical protein